MKARREQLRIDPKKCTACHRCTIACSMKHHGMINPRLSRIKILQFQHQNLNVPVVCMACEDAPCIKVCPMNARTRASNGSVVTDPSVCIGCRACLYVCPAGIPVANPYTGQAMTCDMCDGEASGPWCVAACKDQGALQLCEIDSLSIEIARDQAGRFRKIYS